MNGGGFSGAEVGEYLSSLLGDMPMVLISRGMPPSAAVRERWPSSNKDYVHKDDGADAILDSALSC